jgi:predicted nucleotidyltransferase
VKGRYTRGRWEYTIKMNLQEIKYEDMDWIHLAEDREQERAVLDTIMNIRISCVKMGL